MAYLAEPESTIFRVIFKIKSGRRLFYTNNKKDAVYDKAAKTYFVPANKTAKLMSGSATVSKGSATIKTKLDTMTFKVGAKAVTINTYILNLKTINGKMIKNELYVPISIFNYFGYKATVK